MKFQESWKAHVNTAFYFDCCIFIFCQKYLRIDQKFTESIITRKTESKCWLGCDFAFKFIYNFAIVRLKVWPNQIGRKKGSLVRMKKVYQEWICCCLLTHRSAVIAFEILILPFQIETIRSQFQIRSFAMKWIIWMSPLAWISDFISDFWIVQSNAIEWKL